MSLNLTKDEIFTKLKTKKIKLDKNYLEKIISNIIDLNIKLSNFLKDFFITGLENDKTIGIGSESSGIQKGQGTNPLLWEIGHYCYFYEYHTFKKLIPEYNIDISNGDIYDSFKTSREVRFKETHSKKLIINYLFYVMKTLKVMLNMELNEINSYLILLSILHNHMHCESMIFTQKLLGYQSIFNYKFNLKKLANFEFINIKGGKFNQGNKEGDYLVSFDNEMPSFEVEVKDFHISKYCITELIILQFILDEGYNKKEYWSDNGWRWVTENKIKHPFYWIYKNKNFYIRDCNKIRNLEYNLPACHISWYEADAICKWFGGRLPTESEWEYVATNGGTTKYPWGNEFKDNIANLNYTGNICDVSEFQEGANNDGILQLLGNVWEWCEEPIYPYDGYTIDPVYREFSYPFFGYKKILKGGSWAVPDILINPKYRNAQMPDCRIQFTGFRVVK